MTLETISPVYFESVSAVTATPNVELGSRRTDSNGNKYVYVYNAGNYEIWPGRCGYLGSSNSGYSITATNAASQVGIFAGGVHHATLTTNAYGWLMTEGCCAVSPDTSEVSFDAGDYLTVAVNDGYGPMTGATLSTGNRIGVCISSGVTQAGATFAADLGKAWIRSDIW